MLSNKEVAAAIKAAKKSRLPICSMMTFDTASRSMMAITPADFTIFAVAQGADLIGARCGIGLESCCGTSPAHFAVKVSVLSDVAKRPFDPAAMTVALGTALRGD